MKQIVEKGTKRLMVIKTSGTPDKHIISAKLHLITSVGKTQVYLTLK